MSTSIAYLGYQRLCMASLIIVITLVGKMVPSQRYEPFRLILCGPAFGSMYIFILGTHLDMPAIGISSASPAS